MNSKFCGFCYPLSEIFSSRFEFHIPPFQRPYIWSKKQVKDLFEDLYDAFTYRKKDSYFLGSIILLQNLPNPRVEIIDGQQRLITLTILLATLASKLNQERRDMIRHYIIEQGNQIEGIMPNSRISLRNSDNDFFRTYVQDFNIDELISLNVNDITNITQKQIFVNSKVLLELINIHFDRNSEIVFNFVKYLMRQCTMMAICTSSKHIAPCVFEGTNSRGINAMHVTESLKEEMLKRTTNENRSVYEHRLNVITNQLDTDGFCNLLFCIVRICEGNTSTNVYRPDRQQKIIENEFIAKVLNGLYNCDDFIQNVLEPYAHVYSVINATKDYSVSDSVMEPAMTYSTSSQNVQNLRTANNWLFNHGSDDATNIRSLIWWLHHTNCTDWIPVALYFLTYYGHDPKISLTFFTKLERLAAYSLITNKDEIWIRNKFSAILDTFLKLPDNAKNPQLDEISEFELTTDDKLCFFNTIGKDVYNLPNKDGRNYLIYRLDSFMNDRGEAYFHKNITIEHVLPQTVNSYWIHKWPDKQLRKSWVNRIGNLILLDKDRNVEAGNSSFEEKKELYSKPKWGPMFALTQDIMPEQEWTADIVKKRQTKLKNTLKENWDIDDE